MASNSPDLTVCSSRRFEFPDRATSDVTCTQTQSGDVEIRLDNACDGVQFISQCQPLFISVAATTSTRQTASCAQGM